MKHLRIFSAVALLALTTATQAQQVNTLYFLENAPMRHIVNPAFQPVSNGYFNILPLGYTGFGVGNNALMMSDFVYKDATGQTITALHPNGDRQALLNAFQRLTLIDTDLSLNILSFGSRVNTNGYFHFNLTERIDAGITPPPGLFNFLLGGGMTDLDGGINYVDLSQLGLKSTIYTELAIGYSHRFNEHWGFGMKLKGLLGTAYMDIAASDLGIDATSSEWRIHGNANATVAAPINWDALPENINYDNLTSIDPAQLINMNQGIPALLKTILRPNGYGGAIDLGLTYKPIEQVQITAAVNDLGFIYWNRARNYTCTIDTVFTGAGDVLYSDYTEGGQMSDSLLSNVQNDLLNIAKSINATYNGEQSGFMRMLNANLNIGVDANFWDNRIGLGVMSRTRFYNSRIYEEVTIGAAFRPCHWFNLAASYSLLHNGKYSNIGAGISLMPYDGINLTLTMDYVPTYYANYTTGNTTIPIPYYQQGVNVAAGFSIVWGTNKKRAHDDIAQELNLNEKTNHKSDKQDKKDKQKKQQSQEPKRHGHDSDQDGVPDDLDVCPDTPAGVQVNMLGCPMDSDGDGVPDYLDKCPNTPAAAYGRIDTTGCPIDTDKDGVPDYIDQCPDTRPRLRAYVNEYGCIADTDGDGVPDYKDECPDTPEEAYRYVDATGCPIDTDGDGVPDYKDECPNTPPAAYDHLDEHGCPTDTDGDGVPDYLDECPDTPAEAHGFVDAKGCPMDTDDDGIPDYMDECPYSVGSAINNGCPEVTPGVQELLNAARYAIQFNNGKATLKPSSHTILDQLAQAFIEHPDYIVDIQGHTDNTGNRKFNLDLSDRRAQAVRNYLISKDVPPTQLTAHGYGPDQPISDNSTRARRAENNRIEFSITFVEIGRPDAETIEQTDNQTNIY